ncbi:exonuclease domain-containing protein [Streptomyces sp. NBC_01454]|uniref:exonuclease domain-containing protein n=1 Tax=Streptomyces sp. NBC_01454 TaxID=2975867 RepID=UPI002E3131AE|nr:exonuclease domain-containing protein [Streptomyces sp. NBC_01454]
MTWHTEPLLGFDLETTGINVETARIVTAAAIDYKPGDSIDTLPDRSRLWLADPGVRIPAEATAVHGVTTEQARANGRPAAAVADEIADVLAAALSTGIPVVAMNARYDFTVLDRELRRHNLRTLQDRIGGEVTPGPVVDPFVLDKQADKYRRGSRKLEALAAHYGVALAAAHTADADALAAAEVAVAIAEKYPQLQVHPEQLHAWQVRWAAEQASGLQEYLRRTDSHAVVDSEWPLVPLTEERKVRGVLADLAERWEQMAKSAPDFGDELFIDEPTPVQLQQFERAATYGRAAADLREVLRSGRIPHGLMTDAELDQHSTAQ